MKQTNKADKATVGTFFSVRYPKNAMRSFGTFVSKIDWSKSDSLRELFRPFEHLGTEKIYVADMGKDPFKKYLHQKNTQNV